MLVLHRPEGPKHPEVGALRQQSSVDTVAISITLKKIDAIKNTNRQNDDYKRKEAKTI